MEKNMQLNFQYLKERVIDSLDKSDLKNIRLQLSKINSSTLVSGVGGSSVVSEMCSKILNNKNKIISFNVESRTIKYMNLSGFENIIAISYSGNNYGVDLAFNNNLNKYLLSNNLFDNQDVEYLRYQTTIDKERSFISLGASLIPIGILLNYYNNGNNDELIDYIEETKYDFNPICDAYEIFSGYDTAVASKYLESTLVESGIGIPIIHDKYSYCHGRSTTSINHNNIAIYFNKNTEFDKMMIQEIANYYKSVVVISSKNQDNIMSDYQMLVCAMYLTKYIAEYFNRDLSSVEYNPIVKKLYNYRGDI